MAAQEFVLRIRADDAATATVNKIKNALGKITEPVEKSQKGMKSLGDVGQSSLAKLNKGLAGVAHSASSVVDKIVEIIPGLTAIGAAASIAGVAALAEKFGSFGFSLNRSSKLLGMNAQDLAAWHVAAKRAGVSAEEFDSAMSGSQMSIRAAAYGADPHAMMLLQKMGVQIQHNRDGSIDYLKTQQQIMTALSKQTSVEGQRDAANGLGMGGLLPMIQQGTYGADKARAARKGLVPTPDEIARAVAFRQNVNDLQDSVSGLGNSIGSALIPVLDPLVRGISGWLDQNRVQVADKLAAAAQKFTNWISSIDWDAVSAKVTHFVDAIGGVKGVAIGIAAITFAAPLAGVVSLIASLTTLTATAIPAALLGFTGLGLAAAVAAAAYTIVKIKDSTEPGHFVGRYPGAPLAGPLRPEDTNKALWDRIVQGGKDFVSMPTGRFVPHYAAAQAPLGIRSNNPLNMLDHNKEITYATPEEGIAAAARNLQLGYRGLTLAGIADKWTGGARTGNTPQKMANYVGMLSSGTGLRSDETPDLGNASVVASLVKAQIRAENGTQPYSDDQIGKGVGAGMDGGGTSTDSMRSARLTELHKQAVDLHVTFNNVPSGARTEAKSSSGGYLPTKVNYAMSTNLGAMP